MDRRLAEYRALVVELQDRYQDVSAPQRYSTLMTAAFALINGFCFNTAGRFATEEEVVQLVRQTYRAVVKGAPA